MAVKDSHRRLARKVYWNDRDKSEYECPDCGRQQDEISGTFEVHHKDGNPMNNSEDNLVGLCSVCHCVREGRNPNSEDVDRLVRNLSGGGLEAEDGGSEEVVEPFSLLHEYKGNYGTVVCPGCCDKLAIAGGRTDGLGMNTIMIEHSCCGVSAHTAPSVLVIDEQKAADVDTSERGLKKNMLEEWAGFVEENQYYYANCGYMEDGVVKTRKEERVRTGILLADVRRMCEEWGWEKVAVDIGHILDGWGGAYDEEEWAYVFNKLVDDGGGVYWDE